MDIENIFECKTISKSSLELYKNNLIRLNDNKVPKNINFLYNVEKIQSKLEKYKPNTKRNYIISIVSILSCLKQNSKATKKVKELYDTYFKILDHYNTTLKNQTTKTETEKENWITKDNLNTIYKKVEDDALKVKSFDTKKEYDKYLEYVILSLYTLTAPRRNKDYIDMVVDNPKMKTSDLNYFDIENKQFVFNNYKTKKSYQQQIIDIPDNLFKILVNYIGMRENSDINESEYLLIDFKGNPLSKSNSITRILNKIFGKKIGSSMLRKMYHTNKYSKVIDELEKDAVNMGHSKDVIMNNYIKK